MPVSSIHLCCVVRQDTRSSPLKVTLPLRGGQESKLSKNGSMVTGNLVNGMIDYGMVLLPL